MKLLLDKKLTGLDGKEFPDTHMGKILANSLVNNTGEDAIKYLDWALKLYNGEEIRLDSTDYKKLYKEVENNRQFTRLASAQILKEMERQSEEQGEKA